jgi:anti-sigma factor RsiW
MSRRSEIWIHEESTESGTDPGCPVMASLDAYHRGALGPEEEARVRRHLVLCDECRSLFLDYVQFLEDCRQPSRLSSAEVKGAWEEWLVRKERAEREPEPASPSV